MHFMLDVVVEIPSRSEIDTAERPLQTSRQKLPPAIKAG